MKRMILIITLLSVIVFPQQNKSTFWKYVYYYSAANIIYNGTEKITDAINRDLEPITSIYSSDFSAGLNGWSVDGGLAVAGNIDGIGGENDVLRMTTDATTGAHASRRLSTTTAGVMYKMTFNYYLPSTNTTTVKMTMRDGSGQVVGIMNSTKDTWISAAGVYLCAQTNIRSYGLTSGESLTYTGNAADVWYLKNVKLCSIPYWTKGGNHSYDTTTTMYAGTYGGQIISTGAGNTSTNFISLVSTKFSACTSGVNYRFQLYCYTVTSGTTLSFNLGDITVTKDVPAEYGVLNFDFIATASTTGNIKLFSNKASIIFFDAVSYKSGQ